MARLAAEGVACCWGAEKGGAAEKQQRKIDSRIPFAYSGNETSISISEEKVSTKQKNSNTLASGILHNHCTSGSFQQVYILVVAHCNSPFVDDAATARWCWVFGSEVGISATRVWRLSAGRSDGWVAGMWPPGALLTLQLPLLFIGLLLLLFSASPMPACSFFQFFPASVVVVVAADKGEAICSCCLLFFDLAPRKLPLFIDEGQTHTHTQYKVERGFTHTTATISEIQSFAVIRRLLYL